MTLPSSLQRNPRLSTWIHIDNDRLTVRTGKVELGQGIKTAVASIVAFELDFPMSRIDVISGRTSSGPEEGITAGSMSIETTGAAVRQAAAEIRSHLIDLAAQRLEVERDALTIEEGLVRHRGRNESLNFGELVDGQQIDQEATGEPKPLTAIASTSHLARLDLPGKVTGGRAFLQDLKIPNLHHGRIVRGPSIHHRPTNIGTLDQRSGVDTVLDGDFIGVVASNEHQVRLARQHFQDAITWQLDPSLTLPDGTDWLRDSDIALLVVDGTPGDEPVPNIAECNFRTSYRKPWHMHGSMSPSAAIALWENNHLTIYSHAQGPSLLRDAIASALSFARDQVTVIHAENAGCYGHNGADDAAMDAALLAIHIPGTPVLLKWEREDEHRFEPYSPGAVIDVSANLEEGRVQYWSADVYSQTHSGRPFGMQEASNLIAAWEQEKALSRPIPQPGRGNHSGIHRNADPLYRFPERRIVKHLHRDQRIRTSSTRGLGAYANIFAIESAMDELSSMANMDTVAFRLQHLEDKRAIAVLKRCAVLASDHSPTLAGGYRLGHGFAFAQYKNRQTYAALCVFLRVHEETLATELDHAVIVADAGRVVDPDGLRNQLEGGFIQSASWSLKEAVTFDRYGTTSTNWDSYPILKFSEIPTVNIDLIDHPALPSLGAGEALHGPTPAAIANAIAHATGIRVRQIPLTSDAIRQAGLQD
ncbi:MAG: molybdopterin cofactor-binding domain-containing protein [Pseudomonadota bacterium]